ncbi:hypothetical protein [Streptomyces sp. NPDC001389]|uniref:hypothetical protein n=1 Tax=unclassified Streptomyces TaxID=2593676 RepID=UPI0036C23FD9
MPGVGHHMWNGLDDNNDRAVAVVTAFLQDQPAPLPDYPTRAEIPAAVRWRTCATHRQPWRVVSPAERGSRPRGRGRHRTAM